MPQLPSFVGSDSLYCEATHSSDEVLCYGSDDEYYESPLVRINCLEEQARRYLEGRRPFLLSASLRGPFDKGLWENPWSGRGNTGHSRNDVSSYPQRQRSASAQVQSDSIAPKPASAPMLELGTAPGITIYTDDVPPVSRKRAASADWLRRKNLKRMRSHDAEPAMALSPTMRRGHSADYSRSISVSGVDEMAMDGNEALLSGRQCLVNSNAKEAHHADKRKAFTEKQQRPALSSVQRDIGRSTSAPADLKWLGAQRHYRQSIASTKHTDEDDTASAESWQQSGYVRHTQRVVKVEEEAGDMLTSTDLNTDPTSKGNIAEPEASHTDDGTDSPFVLPTGPDRVPDTSTCCQEQEPAVETSRPPPLRELSAAAEEHGNDEASQQLLGELNATNETAAHIKTETETGETALQAHACPHDAEFELSSRSSSGTDTDAADNVNDTTGITWHTDDDGLVTGGIEKCDKATLPETAPPLPASEQISRSVNTAATSQAVSMDVRLWADSVDASVSSSLTKLPTSPCSPEHAEAAVFYKVPLEQAEEPVLAIPSSGAPPSTPETKQSSLPTPDMSVSIKSFRRFRSPTPTPPPRRRPNKPGQPRSILSYPRRKPSKIPGAARQDRRVRFVLPDDDANDGIPFTYTYDLPDASAEDEEGGASMGTSKRNQGQHGPSRTASPPPQDGALTGTLPSEVEKFQGHFASVANRSKQTDHRASSPEPGHGGLKQSSAAALPSAGFPLQKQRAIWQSPAAVRLENKALGEAGGGFDKENQINDWETQHDGDGEEGEGELPVDDVQEVLDNLDDFLGLWSIEAELAQARSEQT